MGKGDFLFNWPLGLNSLEGLLGCPVSSGQTSELRSGGTGGADDLIEIFFGRGFEEERNDNYTHGAVVTFPLFDLSQPTLPDEGVEDGFELFAAGLVGKDNPRQCFTAERTVGGDHFRPKGGNDLSQGWLPWRGDFAREIVGIHD